MSLQDWHKFGWLKPHKTEAQELVDFVRGLRAEVVGKLRNKYSDLGLQVEDPPEM